MKFLKHITLIALVLANLTPLICRSASKKQGCHKKEEDRVHTILDREADGLSPDERAEISRAVASLAREYQIDPMLILAIMKVESRFDPDAVSHAKAYGLMQVRTIVVKAVAPELGIDAADGRKMIADQTFNLRIGVHYLSDLMEMFGGDLKKALMAYNAGPTTVSRLYRNRPAPNGGYQGRVLKEYGAYSSL